MALSAGVVVNAAEKAESEPAKDRIDAFAKSAERARLTEIEFGVAPPGQMFLAQRQICLCQLRVCGARRRRIVRRAEHARYDSRLAIQT